MLKKLFGPYDPPSTVVEPDVVQSLFLRHFLIYGRNTEINNGQDYHLYRQQVNALHHFKYCI